MEKLLALLEQNARLTNAQLAVMTGKTEEEVAAELAKLEADGIIHGYQALIDWEKAGRQLVEARIEIKVVPKRDMGFDEIAGIIAGFSEVSSVYLMSGGYDIGVHRHRQVLPGYRHVRGPAAGGAGFGAVHRDPLCPQ